MSEQESKSLALQQINALEVSKSYDQLINIMPEHKEMLETVKAALPEVQRATSLFYKTQSQFMDNMMTVSHYTPLRNMRQILAQMNSTRDALKEAHFKLKKKELELKQKQVEVKLVLKEIDNRHKKNARYVQDGDEPYYDAEETALYDEQDSLKIQGLEDEIAEIVANAETTRGYISGAIRQLTNYTEQYNNIKNAHGLDAWTEADFEKEEERYHIMKAFEQAVCAARSRNGQIDEGNHIYLAQIGINGGAAQKFISEFLNDEQAHMVKNDGQIPTHAALTTFLDRMANMFQGQAEDFAKTKGMTTISHNALLLKGDERLLLSKKD